MVCLFCCLIKLVLGLLKQEAEAAAELHDKVPTPLDSSRVTKHVHEYLRSLKRKLCNHKDGQTQKQRELSNRQQEQIRVRQHKSTTTNT